MAVLAQGLAVTAAFADPMASVTTVVTDHNIWRNRFGSVDSCATQF